MQASQEYAEDSRETLEGGRGLCVTSLPSEKDTRASVCRGGLEPSLPPFFSGVTSNYASSTEATA